MSEAEPSPPASRKRSAVAWLKVVLGPFPEDARLDRTATGAAGGVLVLAGIALPVTVATVAADKAVTWWVLMLCVLLAVVGLALVVKSCQRPSPASQAHGSQRPSPGSVNDDSDDKSKIIVDRSKLEDSGISIPEGSSARVADSSLTKSPLTIRDRQQATHKQDNK